MELVGDVGIELVATFYGPQLKRYVPLDHVISLGTIDINTQTIEDTSIFFFFGCWFGFGWAWGNYLGIKLMFFKIGSLYLS